MIRKKIQRIVSDQKKHEQAETTQMQDEQEPEGHMPATGSDQAEGSTLDEAHEMGLYKNATDDGDGKVVEVGIAEQIEKDEKEHQEED